MTFAYRNLQASDVQYFIRAGRRGKVLGSRPYVMLTRALFLVDKEGRAEALRTGVKTIHAGVAGIRVDDEFERVQFDTRSLEGWVKVVYNPEKNETFVREVDGTAVTRADVVILDQHGVWALRAT